jgi:hypothetical protein
MANAWRRFPTVYEINTRVWLAELSRRSGEPIVLGTVPEDEIDRLAVYGFDAVWLMGVWAPSPASRRLARQHSDLAPELRAALPDLRDADVAGSPFAVHDYRVSGILGGEEGLCHLRSRLARRSIRLMLDFVPNHLAIDHPWTETHPEYLVQCPTSGSTGAPNPDDGCFTRHVNGRRIRLAHGRDPYFPPWTDTVQVDYSSPDAREAMVHALQEVANRCDGVRCDMAMLVTNDVFRRVWGLEKRRRDAPAGEFWQEAIQAVRSRSPEFVFLAEVYWGLERELQRQGFDYTYDKVLYDHLRAGDVGAMRTHLRLDHGFQNHAARFVENHDEPRAVEAFGRMKSRAAALLVATLPGLRLFHQGQLEGRRLRIPVQLRRLPREQPDLGLVRFYRRLLAVVEQRLFHDGAWTLLEPRPAWTGNGSFGNVVAYEWHMDDGERALIVVNLGEHRSQALVPVSWPGLGARGWRLHELVDKHSTPPTTYVRSGIALQSEGLYVDLDPFGFHFLSVDPEDHD